MANLSKLNGFRIIITDRGKEGYLDPEDKITVGKADSSGSFIVSGQDSQISLKDFLRRVPHHDKNLILKLLTSEESLLQGLVTIQVEHRDPLLDSISSLGFSTTLGISPTLNRLSVLHPASTLRDSLALSLHPSAEQLLQKINSESPESGHSVNGAIENISWEMATALDWSALTYVDRLPRYDMGPLWEDPDNLLLADGCVWTRSNLIGCTTLIKGDAHNTPPDYIIWLHPKSNLSFDRDLYLKENPSERFHALQVHLARGGTLPRGQVSRSQEIPR